jgi:hypothetical protein
MNHGIRGSSVKGPSRSADCRLINLVEQLPNPNWEPTLTVRSSHRSCSLLQPLCNQQNRMAVRRTECTLVVCCNATRQPLLVCSKISGMAKQLNSNRDRRQFEIHHFRCQVPRFLTFEFWLPDMM